jgi:hypothetical protein
MITEPSRKRHKVEFSEVLPPPATADDAAAESLENATSIHEASLATYNTYGSAGNTGQEETTIRDIGGTHSRYSHAGNRNIANSSGNVVHGNGNVIGNGNYFENNYFSPVSGEY